MQTSVGNYRLMNGNTALNFWPLAPGKRVADFNTPPPPNPVSPQITNPVVTPPPAPRIVVFDIVIQYAQDALHETQIADYNPALANRGITAAEAVNQFNLIIDANRRSRICFAASVPAAQTSFTGTLQLRVNRSVNNAAQLNTLEFPVQANNQTNMTDLVIFAVVHSSAARQYTWVKVQVQDHTSHANLTGVRGLLKVLRDNSSFRSINRQMELTVNASGYLAFNNTRNIIGVQTNWPLIIHCRNAAYVDKAHMIRVNQANARNNRNATVLDIIQMVALTNVNLAANRVYLDAGHGVYYNSTTALRSYEWFVVHRIVNRISDILINRFHLPAANLFRSRSSGIALIAPAQVNQSGAPANGATRYELDLPNHRIRIRNNTLRLRDLSDLLVTGHNDNGTVIPVTTAQRNQFITNQNTAIQAIITRLNTPLQPLGQRVRPNSVRWDETQNNYVYTVEWSTVQPGRDPVVALARNFPIATTDWFQVRTAEYRVLARRTAIWSIANEPGGNDNFGRRVRPAMRNNGALDFMRDRSVEYADVTAPHRYLNHGLQGWSVGVKRDDANAIAPACNVYIILHCNAVANETTQANTVGTGIFLHTVHKTSDQIRTAKTFLKYVDVMQRGYVRGGLVQQSNNMGQISNTNNHRDNVVFFEMEFMNVRDPGNNSRYLIELMMEDDFRDRVAEQITAAIVEKLVSPQPNMDSVYLNHGVSTLW